MGGSFFLSNPTINTLVPLTLLFPIRRSTFSSFIRLFVFYSSSFYFTKFLKKAPLLGSVTSTIDSLGNNIKNPPTMMTTTPEMPGDPATGGAPPPRPPSGSGLGSGLLGGVPSGIPLAGGLKDKLANPQSLATGLGDKLKNPADLGKGLSEGLGKGLGDTLKNPAEMGKGLGDTLKNPGSSQTVRR